jgi:hypothetical protein
MIHVLCILYFQTKPLLSGGSTVWLPACSALKELGPPVSAHCSPTCGFKKKTKQHRGKCLLGTSDFQTWGIQREVSKMRLGNRNPLGIWISIAPYRSLLGAEEWHSHKGECPNQVMYHIPIISLLHPWCQYCKSAEFCRTTTAPTCRYWIIAPWCREPSHEVPTINHSPIGVFYWVYPQEWDEPSTNLRSERRPNDGGIKVWRFFGMAVLDLVAYLQHVSYVTLNQWTSQLIASWFPNQSSFVSLCQPVTHVAQSDHPGVVPTPMWP